MAEPQEITTLHQQLDSLWIRYLDLLDQYTKAQDTIKNSLSPGFFSLAQANFTSPGRRYGQDYYDQRAVASSRVEITDDADALAVKITTLKIEANPQKETAAHAPTPEPEHEKDDTEATQLPTPEPEEARTQEEKPEEDRPRLPSDPLRQFGILIPPALRSAQKSFAKAVRDEGAVTSAINSSRRMRDVEVEIRKARKALKKAEKHAGDSVP